MNCVLHPEIAAATSCEECLKPYCQQCLVKIGDHIYCHGCSMKKADQKSLPSAESVISPTAAFWLGLIPGVGAIYNGEYFKAFVNVVVFGFLISVSNSSKGGNEGFETLFGLMIAAFFFYMPLEAYHTARRRFLEATGVSINPVKGGTKHGFWTGIILTIMGILLFVNQVAPGFLGEAMKFWPLILVGLGGHKIWEYFHAKQSAEIGA
jgi:hypothetical protein